MGWQPHSVVLLINLGVNAGMAASITKQLKRFAIADGTADPELAEKVAAADPSLVAFLAERLATALFNLP